MEGYDQIAAWYAAVRHPEIGVADVAKAVRELPGGAAVLDLGCGDGMPITKYLLGEGFAVVGVDSSAEMVARFQAHFPEVPARCRRAEETDFPAEAFDAVLAWGVLFHLLPAAQEALVPKLARWLRPGGRLLFTAAEDAGRTSGEMNGVLFDYYSLGADRYKTLLATAGLCLREAYADPWENYVFLAEKPG